MWKPEHRRSAERRGRRYPSDLNDAERALIEPMILPAKRGGRRREVNIREVVNATFYVLSTGCQWQALPKDLAISGCGTGTAPSGAFTRRSTWPSASARRPRCEPDGCDHRQLKRQGSSKKGLHARLAGIRCGQEGHGPQTAHPRRHERCIKRRAWTETI
jgi:transposase